jgi:glycerophosphoryl diester phosphodiesterase
MMCWNIAHRGGAGLRPENTLAAFRHAVALGADGAELDVQLSKDGEVVVFHDFSLNPDICRDSSGAWLAKPTLPIKDRALPELQTFDVGRPDPHSEYARLHPDLVAADGERIPTLGAVVDIVRAAPRQFRLFVELKTSFDEEVSASPEALAEAAVEVLHRYNFVSNTIFVGFDWRELRHVKKIAPEAECWFSTHRQHDDGEATVSVLQEIVAAGGEGWFPAYQDVSAETVAEARALNLKIGAWTVNDANAMRTLIGYGLDAICTDRPDILAAFID